MDGRFLFLFVLSGCALVSSAALADPNFGGYGGACAQSQGLAPGCGGGSSNGGRTQNDAYRDRIERENQAIDQYNDGLDAIKSENYPLAEAFFRQALAIRPDYVHAQEELALANGLEAYNSQNYALALSYYQQLQQIDPHDQYVSHHIAKARATMAMTEGFAAWNRGDLTTALADYRQAYAIDPDQGYLDSINKLQNNLQSQQQAAAARQQTAQSVSGLAAAVAAARNDARTQSGLDFKTGDDGLSVQGATPGALGDNIPQTTVTPLQHATTGPDDKAGDQALAAARDAANGGDLRLNYDRGGVKSAGSLPTSGARFGQSPGAAQLVAHIGPAGMRDPEIQQNVAYYQKLDGRKIDAQGRLDGIQQLLDSGGGEPQKLQLQKAALNSEIAAYTADEAATQTQIQKKMTSIGVTWTDTPAPTKGGPATAGAAGGQ